MIGVGTIGVLGQKPRIVGGTTTTISVSGQSYLVHRFTASSSAKVYGNTVAKNYEYLVAAGGAGSGGSSCGYQGGGGGAGGMLTSFQSDSTGPMAIAPGTYSITIGAGGAARVNGQNSEAFGITVVGGGRGGTSPGCSQGQGGANGGSGGGGGGHRFVGGGTGVAGPPRQGTGGGISYGHYTCVGGTGGGHASQGCPTVSDIDGTTRNYAAGGWSATCCGGPPEDYACTTVTPCVGGITAGSNGPANSGSGGGASDRAGGSGVAVVRYRVS